MKAILINAPKDISIKEVSDPERKENEVLIKVRGMGICGSDIAAFKGINPLVTYPRIIGHEIAGDVLEAPRGETKIMPGDRVVIEPCVYCGKCYPCMNQRTNCCENLAVRGVHIDGGMSEFCFHPHHLIHKVPANVSWKHLAMVEPLTISIHAVKRARLAKGEHVVVTGSGPIGLLAALYALVIGAVPIIVDPIDERLALARLLGIPHGINPLKESAVERIKEITGGRMAEAVIEASETMLRSGAVLTMWHTREGSRLSAGQRVKNRCDGNVYEKRARCHGIAKQSPGFSQKYRSDRREQNRCRFSHYRR